VSEKQRLCALGVDLARRFCIRNRLREPGFDVQPDAWAIGSCAYYRPETIHISIALCAAPGRGGRAWSWPGYVVDRTPYGVVCHELGHHVDRLSGRALGAYWSDFGAGIRQRTGEPPLTAYAGENDAEWFAEAFRLFLTNPFALAILMPATHAALRERFEPVIEYDAYTTLSATGLRVLERHNQALGNKFKAARERRRRAEIAAARASPKSNQLQLVPAPHQGPEGRGEQERG
jgi:hypothetical protein